MNQQKKAERPNIGLAHIFGDLAAKKKDELARKYCEKSRNGMAAIQIEISKIWILVFLGR